MNIWVGIGNLTRDPEMRYTGDGTAVTNFAIAINEGKDNSGRDRPPTYVEIEAWEKTGENVAEYLRKGSKCAVQGALKMDQWEDKETGQKRTKYKIRAFSVEFLTPKAQDDDDRGRGRDRDDDDRGRGRERDDRPRSRDRDDDRGRRSSRNDDRPRSRTNSSDEPFPF